MARRPEHTLRDRASQQISQRVRLTTDNELCDFFRQANSSSFPLPGQPIAKAKKIFLR
jgi:hypothetical protein